MIKHFFRRNGKKLIAVGLIFLMWWAGFYCAWKIQGYVIGQYRVIIIRITRLLRTWEGEIERLEKEKEEKEKEEKKIKKYNEESVVG